MAQDDSSTSWDLSFDDDFDVSSDTFEAPSSLPMNTGNRIPSNTSDEGYKSASISTGRQAARKPSSNAAQPISTNKNIASTPSKQRQSSLRSIGLGHVTSSQRFAPSEHSAPSPPSRHRQANSMVYSSPASQKWQGKPLNSATSPRRSISPHNSPLMSSFARAREQQEQLTQGTLSGLLVRFLRNRTLSTLFLRLALFVTFLLLTSLVLTRSPDGTNMTHSSMVVRHNDDTALIGVKEKVEAKHMHQYVSTDDEDSGDPGLERWKQEERRIAHARAAKSFQQAKIGRGIHEELERPAEDGSISLFEDTLLKDDLFNAQEEQESQAKLYKQNGDTEEQHETVVTASSVDVGSSLDTTDVSEEGFTITAAILDSDDAELRELPNSAPDHTEEHVPSRDDVRLGDFASVASAPIDESIDQARKLAPIGRAAILAQVEASREAALLGYQKLQDERVQGLAPPTAPIHEDSQLDFMPIELDDREATRPGEDIDVNADAEVEDRTHGENLASAQEELQESVSDLDAEVDSIVNVRASLLDANAAAAVAYPYKLKRPAADSLPATVNVFDNSTPNLVQPPMKLAQLKGFTSEPNKLTDPIKQGSRLVLAEQDEATSFEDNLANLNIRRLKNLNGVGRLAGKRRINIS